MRIATASAHRKDVDRIEPGSPSPRFAGLVVASLVVALPAYFLGLHALVASHAWPTLALALILAPWLLIIGPRVARAFTAAATGARLRIVALALCACVAVAGALIRFGRPIGEHADAVLYVENLAFFGWLAWLFASSLAGPREPLVTQLARTMRRGDMPPAVVRYTRSVTIAWACFFALSMAVSTFLFATQSREAWSLFINVLMWPLVATVFVIEYAIRRTLLRNVKHVPFGAAIRAFRERAGGDR